MAITENNSSIQEITSDHLKQVEQTAKCLFTGAQVELALDKMAEELRENFSDTMPVFLCVVVGGIVTLGQLLTRISFPLEVDYVHVTRYQGEFSGKSELKWLAQPATSLNGRTVILVDDIIDGGITLKAIHDYAVKSGAKNIYSAVLVDKPGSREANGLQRADVVGLTVGNEFIYGYGMDYKNYLRNARGIFAVHPDLIK
jgi:hypoxanthine phosphoribosyltransferase